MSLPLLITGDEHVPIYLQLVHQIRYLITSRQLVANAKLPSVRSLAHTLGINAGTVAQAYRILQDEKLIDSKRGSGTFVMPLVDETARFTSRQALVTNGIDDLVTQAFALGFDAAAIRQYLHLRLQQRVRLMPFVLVAPTAEAAEKYALLVTKELSGLVLSTVTPCTIEQLERAEEWVRNAYAQTYFTLTFVPLVSRVETALSTNALQSEVVALTAQVTDETIFRLRNTDPHAAYALVTEARNVNSALTIIAQHSRIDTSTLLLLTERSQDSEWREVATRRVIYTFGVTSLLNHHQVPEAQRLELGFTLSEDSCIRLKQLVTHHALVANLVS